MSGSSRRFRLARLEPRDATEAHAFHIASIGQYLWPRSAEEFAKLVEAGFVYSAREAGRLVGLCYVKDDDDDHPEFGGVFLDTSCRGLGVALALAVVSLAAHLVERPPSASTELVAHVHEENPDPRSLLEGLGFEYVRKTKPPIAMVPSSMKRNPHGEVVGDVFLFRFPKCSELADLLLKLTRDHCLKPTGPVFELAGARFNVPMTADTLKALREIGNGYRNE